jgi:hypothetical protein
VPAVKLVIPVGVNTCVPTAVTAGVKEIVFVHVAPTGTDTPAKANVLPTPKLDAVHGEPILKVLVDLTPAGKGIEKAAPETAVAAVFFTVTVSTVVFVAVIGLRLSDVLTTADAGVTTGDGVTALPELEPPLQAANTARLTPAKIDC